MPRTALITGVTGQDGAHLSELPQRRWHVVMTQPHREALAAANLERQGFEVFLPRLAKTVRHARRTRHVLRPLFHRYLFVAFDPSVDRWRPVRSTVGVSAMIMDGERPRPAPTGVVEALRAAADGVGGFDYRDRLTVGERVRFLAGPFAERIGALRHMDDEGRVHVLLEVLGAERTVAATAANLMPLGG